MLWDRRACDLSPPPPAYEGSSEVSRRIYLVERTSTGTFEVTAHPSNHGNFCKGSSEAVGRPLSKCSGGVLLKLGSPWRPGATDAARPPPWAGPGTAQGWAGGGASCQGPGLGLATFASSLLVERPGCSPQRRTPRSNVINLGAARLGHRARSPVGQAPWGEGAGVDRSGRPAEVGGSAAFQGK